MPRANRAHTSTVNEWARAKTALGVPEAKEVGRKAEGGDALMGLTVDAPVPTDVLSHVGEEIGAWRLRAVTLPA